MGASYQYATLPCSNNFLDTLTLTFFCCSGDNKIMSCSSSGNSYIDSFSSIHSDGSMIIDESSFMFSLRSSFTSSSFVDSLTDYSDSDDD